MRCPVHLLANRPSRSSTVRIKPNDTTSSTALTLQSWRQRYGTKTEQAKNQNRTSKEKEDKEDKAKTCQDQLNQLYHNTIQLSYHIYAYQ